MTFDDLSPFAHFHPFRSYSGVTLQQRVPVTLTRQSALTESTAEPQVQGQLPNPGGDEFLPPALPPRYNGTHSRSMSLDRKQLALPPGKSVIIVN